MTSKVRVGEQMLGMVPTIDLSAVTHGRSGSFATETE
jgi:hypothetical protein